MRHVGTLPREEGECAESHGYVTEKAASQTKGRKAGAPIVHMRQLYTAKIEMLGLAFPKLKRTARLARAGEHDTSVRW